MKNLPKPIPEYPSTIHLPWKPNTKGDRIASFEEAEIVFKSNSVIIEEKIDGANCGMALVDGHPMIRSRTKILRKGDLNKGQNPSMAQFASAFTWFYKNQDKFSYLENMLGPITVYGEWMVQQHGMEYDLLPDWFIAYDVYSQLDGKYFARADVILANAGFTVPPLLSAVPVGTYVELEELANGQSQFATDKKREGIYIKVGDGRWTTHRFKMVRQGFLQGSLLGDDIKKNICVKN